MSGRACRVLLGSSHVGTLTEAPTGRVEFRFTEHYRSARPRPVLGQRFEDDLERTYRARVPGRLPAFFANLLPEPGRLRKFLEEATGVGPGDDFGLLSAIGTDLPGAVTVRAEGEAASGDLASARTTQEPTAASGLRFSLAGVQLKVSMSTRGNRFVVPGHDEDGDWIVKFPGVEFPGLVENEDAMLEWARRIGFDVPARRVVDLHDEPALRELAGHGESLALAVRRYDRSAAGRVHQEDFAQVAGVDPSRKYDDVTYESLGVLVRAILGEEGLHELLRRLAFVVACGNCDAHLMVDDYESRRHAVDAPDPIEAILFRMEQQGLSRKDLEPMIGSRARVSEVLGRKRPLTLAMVRRLRDGLGISADVLVGPEPRAA